MHILVQEEDVTTREAIVSALTQRGHTAFLAISTQEALYAARNPRIDLVLCDVLLRSQSGLDFIHLLHASRPDLAIIVFTGANPALWAAECDAAGATAFVRKPATAHALVIMLERIHTGRRCLPVVVIDENLPRRKLVRNAIKTMGFRLHRADTGAQAAAWASCAPLALWLVSATDPDLGALLRYVRVTDTPILCYAAPNDAAVRKKLVQAGVGMFVAPPQVDHGFVIQAQLLTSAVAAQPASQKA